MTTIAIVEDEALIAEDIRSTLGRLGYQVLEPVATGAEAIALIARERPDLVLMDIRIEGPMDGVEAASQIRQSFDTPVVFLTSHSDEATLARAKTTEPYGYLLKPFDDSDLRVTIEIALAKRALEGRRAEKQRWFAATLGSIGDAVVATHRDGAIAFMNGAAEALTGWTRSEAEGLPVDQVVRFVDRTGLPVASPVHRAIEAKKTLFLPAETGLIRKDEARLPVDDSASPIVDAKGQVVGGVVVFRDITERVQLERRVAHAERLASIGSMAAATAHEINNPLTYVVSNVEVGLESIDGSIATLEGENTELARRLLGELLDLRCALRQATEGAHKVRAIIDDVKRYSRAEEITRSVLDLPEVLDAAARLALSGRRHGCRLKVRYGTTPFVEANEGQLTQVFTNLLMNASEAVAEYAPDRQEITVRTHTDATGRAVAEISDLDGGIPDDIVGRIFEPFFTTKPAGVGTGLGLAISHRIVSQLGGEIVVDTQRARGTTFRVVLPPAKCPNKETAPPLQALPIGVRGRILVVDDQAPVGAALERILRKLHDVKVVHGAREALAVIDGGADFDLVFCDMNMPEVDGMAFHAEVAARHPHLLDRLVFMTGGSMTEETTAFLAAQTNPTLAKPFALDDVRKLAAEVLERLSPKH